MPVDAGRLSDEGYYFWEFNNPEEFFDIALDGKADPASPTARDSNRASRKRDSSSDPWAGTKTWDDAVKLVRMGWREGLDKIEPLADEIAKTLGYIIKRPRFINSVVGGSVCIPAYLSGSPACMRRRINRPSGMRVIRIVVNVSCSGGVDPETMIKRGAVACGLASAVQRAGYSASIVVGDYAASGEHKFGVEVAAKKADELMDMDRIAFMCANPAMLRRIAFSFEENLPADIVNKFGFHDGSGYGRPLETPPSRRGDIYFGEMKYGDDNYSTPEKAVAYAISELKRIGVLEG